MKVVDYFNQLPLRRKISAVIMTTTLLSLLLSTSAFLYLEISRDKKNIVNELTGIATIIGDNSTAAMEFDDIKVGNQILGALHSDNRVIAAAVYDQAGKHFALYKRHSSNDWIIPDKPAKDGHYLEHGHLLLFTPIMLKTQRIGTVYIQLDLKELYNRIKRVVVTVIMVSIVVLMIAFLFSRRIQRVVTDPILRLASTAQQVSAANDFSLRVPKTSTDELGILIDQFNNMLEQISKRDQALQEAFKLAENHASELTRSNFELQQFAYIASHDLQEPLRTISNMVTLLKRQIEKQLDAESKEYMDFILQGSARMQLLIKDLLDYSRVGTKGGKFELLDCNSALENALLNLRAEIESSNAVITNDSLPTVVADANQIVRLFQNLIGNAVKYRSTDDPIVHISYTELPTHWQFSVKDNGLGIDPRYHERIFEMFRRLHRQEEYEGTGMGLTICRKIAERHKGEAWVQSGFTAGSTFFFSISKSLTPT